MSSSFPALAKITSAGLRRLSHISCLYVNHHELAGFSQSVVHGIFQLSADHTVLKLGDFGLARATEGTRQTKTQIGSYRYMAPEVVTSGGRYSKRADVHSFGEFY